MGWNSWKTKSSVGTINSKQKQNRANIYIEWLKRENAAFFAPLLHEKMMQ